MSRDSRDLASKYRPRTLEEVVGQDAAVSTLLYTIGNDLSHAFLLSGPTGVGKTTLARAAARLLNAERYEIDAATYTGIDAMRGVQTNATYMPLAADRRALIVDEAHRLSQQAWDSCLKMLEEPPAHVYWFLCTTAPGKLPATIRNRCTELRLQPIPVEDLHWLLGSIVAVEWGEPVDDAVLKLCAVEADGSARKAIVNLSMCHTLNREQARAVLRERAEPQPVADLCQLLMKGARHDRSWLQAMAIVANMSDDSEQHRINVCNYLSAVLRKSKTDSDAAYLLNILEQFSMPYHPGEKQAGLLRSIGRVLFGG